MVQPVLPSPRLPQAQLLELVNTLAGVQSKWDNLSRPLLGQRPGTEKAWLLCGVQSWLELGTDELRYVWNAETQNNDEFVVGQRAFTLTLQAFSLDTTIQPYDLLERVRFRLRSQTARALMVPTLALRDFQRIVNLPPDQQAMDGGHIVLRSSLDVRMLCVVGANPNDQGGGGVIESCPVPAPVIGGNLLP